MNTLGHVLAQCYMKFPCCLDFSVKCHLWCMSEHHGRKLNPSRASADLADRGRLRQYTIGFRLPKGYMGGIQLAGITVFIAQATYVSHPGAHGLLSLHAYDWVSPSPILCRCELWLQCEKKQLEDTCVK